MQNRIVVEIGGQNYTILADDAPEYVLKTAKHVDEKMTELNAGSSYTAAVMAALNIADEYFKAQQLTDHLRVQVREYAEETAKLRAQLAKKAN